MHRDDLPPDPPGGDDARDEDPDRAAILARRKRFIAIALSSLTSGAACAQPQPCLSIAQPESGNPPPDNVPVEPTPNSTTPVDPTPTNQPAPESCLKVAAPSNTTKEPAPEACLKVAAPSNTTKEPSPQPCLKVAPPPKEPEPTTAPPEACLRVAPPKQEPARPTPCLKVARPKDP